MHKTFHEFEHAGWQLVADAYQQYFGSLTSQTIPVLLDAVGVSGSTSLLDIATGPGYVAEEASKRGCDVVGIDFSSEMVEIARKLRPGLRIEEGDAERLAFPDQSFDAATMNFGMLHMERPELAMAESQRVLKDGGRFAFSVWGLPEDAVGFGMVLKAIREYGDPTVPLPQGPPFFRFSDTAESKKEMEKAGFGDVVTTKVSMLWQLEGADAFFNAFYYGTPRTGGILRAQTKEQLQAIRSALEEALIQFQNADGKLEVPMVSLVVSGLRKG